MTPLALLDALTGIYNFIKYLPQYVLIALVDGINALVLAVGVALTALLSLLPSFPDAPEAPTMVKNINWVFPIGSVVTVLLTCLVLFTAFFVLRIALRWLKAA
jgi:hypothetical protein